MHLLLNISRPYGIKMQVEGGRAPAPPPAAASMCQPQSKFAVFNRDFMFVTATVYILIE